ncbi:phosphopantetheine-binding protein [Aequorivita sp. KMM 9714]|uniref:acyl carrier protein n=1 Tax=Aequorivita sp. KMM 9714 TaxID=2707173 RepID=UPI0013EBB03D|nr:phosphopantetheine-binding protein [Aequorivita sp. KMM 9714]NGX83932.1 acyl carrier protein [Aequorivita sp. KMM 9714]
MTSEDIYKKIEPIIKNYLPEDVSKMEISRESDLTKELNINSAHLIDIVLDVEDVFDIEIKNEDLEKLRNLNDVINLIKQKTE